jgi:hypothetical protein
MRSGLKRGGKMLRCAKEVKRGRYTNVIKICLLVVNHGGGLVGSRKGE